MTPGWYTIDGPGGKTHLLDANGKTACATRRGPWGVAMGLLFSRPWRPAKGEDHVCAYCNEVEPRECRCGRSRCLERQRKRSIRTEKHDDN